MTFPLLYWLVSHQPIERNDFLLVGVSPTSNLSYLFSVGGTPTARVTIKVYSSMSDPTTIADFLTGKSALTQSLFHRLVNEYSKLGAVTLHPAKTMIGIDNGKKRIAWITQLGKNFVHVVFPFKQPYTNNLCFQKIAQVPETTQYNHHFRMYNKEDINEEVIGFMKLAFNEEGNGCEL